MLAWLQQARSVRFISGERRQDYGNSKELISRVERVVPGSRFVLFIMTASLVLMIGAVGTILFAFDVWEAPIFVGNMDLNLQFIFVIFAIFTFIISMTIAALYAWAKTETKGGRYR